MTTRFQAETLDYEKATGEVEHREGGARFADSSSLAAATTRDSEKGSSRYAASTTGIAHVENAKQIERKLVRKLGEFEYTFFLLVPFPN